MARISDYGGFELPPEGHAHPAALVSFVDMGATEGKFGMSRQANLAFELLDEKTPKGKPVLAFKRIFNLSARSKNFREILRNLTGLHDVGAVEARELLGRECLLAIEHKTTDAGTFADVEVRALRGKPTGKKPETSFTYFSLDVSDFNEGELNDLPEWQREKIVKSPTFAETQADLKALKDAYGKTASEIVKDRDPINNPDDPVDDLLPKDPNDPLHW